MVILEVNLMVTSKQYARPSEQMLPWTQALLAVNFGGQSDT